MDSSRTQSTHNDTSIRGVLMYILRHPFETAIRRWHWKAALFSALFRTPIFIIAYHKQGFGIAAAAATTQFIFRTLTGGINGSIIQSFSKVEPPWHAVITVPVVLTIITHIFEYLIQIYFDSYYGTNMADKAILASVTVSVLTAIFNLFAMRRGVLLVKDSKEKSFLSDVAYIPRLIFDFVMIPPRNIYKRLGQGQYLISIFIALMTALGTGIIGAILRRKESWGYWTGGIVLGLTIFSVIMIALYENYRAKKNRDEKKIDLVGDLQID